MGAHLVDCHGRQGTLRVWQQARQHDGHLRARRHDVRRAPAAGRAAQHARGGRARTSEAIHSNIMSMLGTASARNCTQPRRQARLQGTHVRLCTCAARPRRLSSWRRAAGRGAGARAARGGRTLPTTQHTMRPDSWTPLETDTASAAPR